MRFGYREACLDHDTGGRHPESPDRLRAVRRALTDHHEISYAEGKPATKEAIEAVHDPAYVAEIEAFCAAGGGQWDPDTIAVEATWEAALASAGLACWTAQEALSGAKGRQTPFALGRPPGHHATGDDAMGFCFFNNAAVAAQAVLDGTTEGLADGDGASEPETVDRVAIYDWDVHHGNGTQDIFDDREDVFYCSVHEDGLYPGTGAIDEIGSGPGEGTTMNAPLPAGCGDPEYAAVFEESFGPAIEAFDPDLLLVSAGFDAHEHDPISRMRVSTEGYGVLTEQVRVLTERVDCGLGFVLEGGYGLDTLADGVAIVDEVFDGYDPVATDEEANERCRSVIEEIEAAHGRGSK
jgi:acetoin utilization deacetylase AcuC-like enzyme